MVKSYFDSGYHNNDLIKQVLISVAYPAVIVETATLSETALAEYCRKKGLYSAEIMQWKSAFLQVPQRVDKSVLKLLNIV